MNQAIVDDAYNLMLENRINILIRHCKIGKVIDKMQRFKRPPMPLRVGPTPSQIRDQEMYDLWLGDARAPTPQYVSKCGCKVGSACGNVACPHRLAATC